MKGDGKVLVIIGVFAIIGASLAGTLIYKFTPQEMKDGYNKIQLPMSNELYGDIYTDRPTKSLSVNFNPKTNTLVLEDYKNERGGNFIIKNAKEHFGKDSIKIKGESYTISETAINDELRFYIPHFSLVEISPIYAGIYYMGQHDTTNTQEYAIYCESTFTNATMHFKGYNATNGPFITVGGETFTYSTDLANGTWYNFTIPIARFDLNATNQITVGTNSGGVQWVLRGDKIGYNITWDMQTSTFKGNDEYEYHNVTLSRYINDYTTITKTEVNQTPTLDFAINGDYTGTYANLSGAGQFILTESGNQTIESSAGNASISDTTGDTIADIQTADQTGNSPSAVIANDGWYTANRNDRLYIDDFCCPTVPAGHTITGVNLAVKYSVESGYTGTSDIRWRLEGGIWNTTGIVPTGGEIDEITYFDLFAVGVNNTAEIQTLDIDFVNNDPTPPADAVSFDYMAIEIITNEIVNVSAKHRFGTWRFPTNTTEIKLYVLANYTTGSEIWKVCYGRSLIGESLFLENIVSDTPTLYEIDMPLSLADEKDVYICVGCPENPVGSESSLYVDEMWINYTYLKGVVGNFTDKTITVPLLDVTHHHEVVNITYEGTNLTHDSTNYVLNETAHTLTITLPQIARPANNSLNVTILNVNNNAPRITTRPTQWASVDIGYVYKPTVRDYESDNLTWEISTDADWIKFNNVTGKVHGRPDVAGIYEVTIWVNDSYGGSASQFYNITVGGNAISVISGWFSGLFTGGITIAGLGTLAMIGYYLYRIESARKGNRRDAERTQIQEKEYKLKRDLIKARIAEIRAGQKAKKKKKSTSNVGMDERILFGES